MLKGRITKDSLLESIQQFDAYYQQTYARHFTLPRGAVNLPQQPYLILGGGSGFFAKSLAYPYLGEKKVCAGQQSKWRRCSVDISMSVMPKKVFPRTP